MIEQTCPRTYPNYYMEPSSTPRAGIHPMAMRVLKILFFGALTCVCAYFALLATLGGGVVTGMFLAYMCDEPVVEADARVVNPENEGKLVRIKGEAVFTGEAVDPVTGVKAAVPMMRRENNYYHSVETKPRHRDFILRHLDETTFAAPGLKIGAYPIIRLNENPRGYMVGFSDLSKDEVKLSSPADNRTLTPVEDACNATFILNDSDGEPMAALTYRHYGTSPVYILGRQVDGCLDMSDPEANTFLDLIDWREKSRSSNLGSGAELILGVIGVLVVDLLLLLPLAILSLRAVLAQLLPGWNIIRLHPVDLGWRLGSAVILGGAGGFIVFGYESPCGVQTGYPLSLLCLVYAAAQLCRTVQLWRQAGNKPPEE